MRIEIHPSHPQPRKIAQVAEILHDGGVIVYPTDTMYALGCAANDKRGLERIRQIKKMPASHLLSLICADLSDLSRYAIVDDYAYRLMRRLVPGPFTFVLRATRLVPKLLLHKQQSVGIRVPNHAVAQAIVRVLGGPLVTTSLKLEEEFIFNPEIIDERIGNQVDAVIDGGEGGLEASTILDLRGGQAIVLRQGVGQLPFH